MRIYHLFYLLLFFSGILTTQAQYTETINSNRPGNSQGAFAPGRGVLQIEAGAKMGQDQHELIDTSTDLWGLEYALRFGVLFEELEISFAGSFLNQSTDYVIAGSTRTFRIRDFDANAIGLKYLIYDPYKNAGEKKPNLYSWRANQRFDWSTLIPAVALYAGANLAMEDNAYLYPDQSPFSPRVAIITQNNWGPWALVLNFIGDKIGEPYPVYSGIVTVTHAFSSKFSIFGEFQEIISDPYSDEVLRGGLAYLFHKNFQADLSGLVNVKDTPSRWQMAMGLSFRFDWHKQDKFIEQPEE